MAKNRIEITCEAEPNHWSLVPALNFKFGIKNDLDHEIMLGDTNYEIYIVIGNLSKMFIGRGVLYPPYTGQGNLGYWTIPENDELYIESLFELGFEKLNRIEFLRKKHEKKPKNIDLRIDIHGRLIKLIDRANSKVGENTFHLFFKKERERVKIPFGDWIDFLDHWGKELRIITVSLDTEKILDELKERWHKIDNSDVIQKLMDLAGVFDDEKEQEREFVSSMTGEGELEEKIKSMIESANEEILISGWIDTTLLTNLKKKAEEGVSIKILTKKPETTSPTPTKNAYKRLSTFSEAKRNSLMHTRLLIIDNNEVLASSADLTNHSLTLNFEAGIWSKDRYVVVRAKEFFDKIWNHEETKSVEAKDK